MVILHTTFQRRSQHSSEIVYLPLDVVGCLRGRLNNSGQASSGCAISPMIHPFTVPMNIPKAMLDSP